MKMKRTQRNVKQLNSSKKVLNFDSSNDSEDAVPVKKKKGRESNGYTAKKTRKKAIVPSSDSNEHSDDISDTSSVKPKVQKKRRGRSYALKRTRKKPSTVSSDLEETSHVQSNEEGIGIIEKVTLKNFMCHSNLEFEFGPHVNFIIGRNGSGKSAILSGIMIALGSRASNTGRAQNLAGYIQTNKQNAYATVTIKNSGPDAYLPNEYGPRITVERRIGQDGHGAYKLKAASGKLVSQKRDELSNILDNLNIQVENPVSVLTQDASKSFLDSKDVKKKYEFFFKATQLEKLKEQYDEAELKRQHASITLKNKKSALPNAKREVLNLERQVKFIQHLNSQCDKQHLLQNELAWAIVIDAEHKELKAKNLVEGFKQELENLQQKVKEVDGKMDLCQKSVAELTEKDNAAKSEIDELRIIYSNALKSHHDLKRDYGILQVKHDNFKLKIESINAEREHIQNTLDELAQRSQRDLDSEREYREQQLIELEQINHQLINSCQELGKKLQEQNQELVQKEDYISALSKDSENLENNIRRKKYEIGTMISSITNQEYQFGSKMPHLREKIKAERRKFQREPIGPIGLYVKIVKAEWSFAVEKCLSHGFLKAFCCDNVNDLHTLREMMKEILGPRDNPQIIISKFVNEVHNVSQHKVHSNFQTVFDMVTSDNPIILNCLIDQKSIETVLLIEHSSDAVNLMLHSPPRNCLCAYTIKGDQIYPEPNYRYYSCKQKMNSHSLLQRFGTSDISAAEQQINSLKQNTAAKNHEIDLGKSAMQGVKNRIRNLQVEQNEIKKKIKANDQRIKECHDATSNQVDVSAMHAELDTQLKRENKFKSELGFLKDEINEKIAESKNKKKEADESDAAVNSQMDIRKKFMHDIGVMEEKRAKFLRDRENFEKRIEKDKSSMKEAAKHHADMSKDLELSIEAASKLCDRMVTMKSVDVLKSELKELEIVLRERTMDLDIEQIKNDYIAKKKQMIASEKEIQNLKETIKKMKDMIIFRQKKFDEIRSLMTLRVQYLFQMNLSARSFSGRLIFDHHASTLTVAVNPNTTEKLTSAEVNANRKTYNLSGGERSFVTVALLMALSDTSEIPFHILDEYDVFMDNMNKEQSLKMMIEKANEQRDNQFIFLSPLDLPPSAFTNQSLIQIQRMPDPERGKVRPVEEIEE